MVSTPVPAAAAWRRRLGGALPALIMAPPLLLPALYVLGFTAWTTWISFTPSTLMPDYAWVGLRNYRIVLGSQNWHVAFYNLVVYSLCFVTVTTVVGFLLAVLIDQHVRAENLFRTIFLYPLAVSFVVTGTVWRWLLNPGIGLQRLVQELGWTGFRFGWISDRNMAIYAIAIAGIWQACGFAMALFLAGIRSVNPELLRAAEIDGAPPWRTYLQIVLPSIRPVLLAVLVILLQNAVKTFDLIRALTNAGPGIATTMPAVVVYDLMFQRGLMGQGSAAAVLMLLILFVVLAPYSAYQAVRARRERRRG